MDEQRSEPRTIEKATESSLFDAIETMSEGFALFDAEDRLQMFNRCYVEQTWPQIAEILEPGVTFETIIQETVKHGVWDGSDMDLEKLFQVSMERHRNLPSVCEIKFPNGRWIKQSKRRTASGGVVAIYADITEIKRRETELEESERRLLQAQHIAHVGDWARDLDGQNLRLSDESIRILGMDPDVEPTFENFFERVHPEDKTTVRQITLSAVEKGVQAEGTYRVIWRDGSIRVIFSRVEVVHDKSNAQSRVYGTIHDITERIQTDGALGESENRYRELALLSPDGIMVHSDGVIVYANPSLARIFGAGCAEDLIGRRAIEFAAPEEKHAIQNRRKDGNDGANSVMSERRFIRIDGSETFLESAIAQVDWNGKQSFLVILRDINSRRQSQLALAESEERYRKLALLSPDGIMVHRDGVIVYANQSLARILAIDSPDQLIGTEALSIAAPEEHEKIREHRKRTDAGGQEVMAAGRFLRADGSETYLERVMSPFDWDGKDSYLVIFREVNQRREAEQRLTDSIESISEGFVLYDNDDRLVLCNSKYKEIYAASAAAMVPGATFEEIVRYGVEHDQYAEAKGREEEFIRGRVATHRDPIGIIEQPLMDGRWLRIEERKTKDGGVVGIRTDISEIKRRETALQESERRLLNAQHIAHVGDWERDFDGKYFRLSNESVRILGLENYANPTFENFFERVHPEDREIVRLLGLSAAQKGIQVENSYRMIWPDGSVRTVLSRVEVVQDKNGEPARLYGTIQDITESIRARRADRRLAAIVESSTDAIISVTLDGVVTAWNAAAENLYLYSAEEAIGSSILIIAPDERAEEALDNLQTAAGRGIRQFETVRRRKDGTLANVMLALSMIEDEAGNSIEVSGIHHDITDRKRAEEQLRQAQKMEAVGQLTGGVAHDFNNLLAATMTNAQLLKLKLKDRDDLQAQAQSIIAAAQSGAELTHRLLAFSRNQTLQPKSVRLGVLCAGMTSLLKRSLGETIEIKLTNDTEAWDVLADPVQVESALLNLAINASHAMPNGGKLAIKIENAPVTDQEWAKHWEGRPGDYVALRVTDAGTGIPEDVLEHVFEPFFTTKEVGQGSGLGLSMVYGFAQQSGGFTTIDSTVGNGTTVTIYLPKADPGKVVADAPAADAEVQKGRGETILLIEDDAPVRESTTELLKMVGYKVLVAKDGTSALKITSDAEHIDLLLSDVMLPGGMNGIEIYQKIHQQRPRLKCLFMSGYASLPDQPLPEGTELLSKPVAMGELTSKIRKALDAGPVSTSRHPNR